MQQLVPPTGCDKLGKHDHDQAALRLAPIHFVQIGQQRPNRRAVGGFQHQQGHLLAPNGPPFTDAGGNQGFDVDHYGRHVFRQGAGKVQSLECAAVHAGYGHDDLLPLARSQVLPWLGTQSFQRELRGHRFVVTLDRPEDRDEEGNEQDHDPGPVDELGGDDDGQDHSRGPGAQAIDGHLPGPARPAEPVPVAHHARLRQGEGQKNTQRIERDEPVGQAAKEDDQHRGQNGQGDDAVGKDQPVAQAGELAGQVPVAGEDGRQPWKVGKRGVGRQDQDEGRGHLQGQVEGAIAKDLPADL